MPKFAPNTGFRMPGLGSKEKNSASNFRDEQHVDKMGYCDNTPDEMLPSGSSPLNYKPIVDDDPYTSARYSGELKQLSKVADPRPKPEVQTENEGGGGVTNIKGDTNIKGNTNSNTEVNNNLKEIGNPGKFTYRKVSDQGRTNNSYAKSYKNADKSKYPSLASWEKYVRKFNKDRNSSGTNTITGQNLSQTN